ncbi:taste receptor type 2 member 109 [Rattus norvegicus]|uniref:Taste receptor type 2 member 109 n=1 Tax=Rattus norvegicus TaxID=10116 RepID=TR109_RAT|nr:taste receptor type 2 member 109 [Rattus norvegicus]Q675B9.1 RecName: Full=Taste receptor type 2 member 109; Short=T2R109; AltName: Full=Taste receptor type 2 member 38; Short=T2R38 [Rattus norvegicus]AAS57909.1 putative taste receptor T2R38 [Rattus norvegicus]|eukprot:NP_001074408.1 taste receptor type 2 member 109 [Rattus norvegicus]
MEHFLKSIFDISKNVLPIILFIELIIGIIGNGFMALVHCMDWVKRKKMSLVNQILTTLATSRICLLWFMLLGLLITLLDPDLASARMMIQVASNLWIIANHMSIWLATCLTVFYFLKIANFSSSLFLYLKWRVEKVISVIFLVSLVLLFLNMLLMNLENDMCIAEYHQINISYSFIYHYRADCERRVLRLHIIILSVPFVLSLPTFLLLIFSLWTHHKKMQQHVQGRRDASTTAHFKALQTVIAFLLLYCIFILSMLLQFWKYELMKKPLFILFCHIVYGAFPSFHSYVLILGDMKLRQASLSVLLWLKCRPNYIETLDL